MPIQIERTGIRYGLVYELMICCHPRGKGGGLILFDLLQKVRNSSFNRLHRFLDWLCVNNKTKIKVILRIQWYSFQEKERNTVNQILSCFYLVRVAFSGLFKCQLIVTLETSNGSNIS